MCAKDNLEDRKKPIGPAPSKEKKAPASSPATPEREGLIQAYSPHKPPPPPPDDGGDKAG